MGSLGSKPQASLCVIADHLTALPLCVTTLLQTLLIPCGLWKFTSRALSQEATRRYVPSPSKGINQRMIQQNQPINSKEPRLGIQERKDLGQKGQQREGPRWCLLCEGRGTIYKSTPADLDWLPLGFCLPLSEWYLWWWCCRSYGLLFYYLCTFIPSLFPSFFLTV